MWHAAFLTALLLGSSLGDFIDDPVENKLRKELWELEHEGRHRHKRFLGLVGTRHDISSNPSTADSQLLAGRHPAVAGKLQHMGHEVQDLEDRKHAAAHARSNLEGVVKEAIDHMNSVTAIKSQLAKTEVQIRGEERKIRRLEDDRLRMDRTHHSLTSSLRRLMSPKIEFAEARLKRREKVLHRLEDEEDEWKNKEKRFHAASLAMLEERDKTKADLEGAIVAEEKAHRERIATEKHFDAVKHDTHVQIEGYRYAQAEEKAAETKEMRGSDEEKQDEASLKRLKHIYNLEQGRVDHSMAIGKDKVQSKIEKLESEKQKSMEKLEALKRRYSEWESQQQTWTDHLADTHHKTSTASKDYADAQEAVLASARDQVVMDAEQDSDWAWDDESPFA